MERLPGTQHATFASIDKLKDFIMDKIEEHRETMDPGSPRDYIDCFLNRLDQVLLVLVGNTSEVLV